MPKSLLHERLVQRLAIGALPFGLDAGRKPPMPANATEEIVVGEARIRNPAQTFHRTWQRAPSTERRSGPIESAAR